MQRSLKFRHVNIICLHYETVIDKLQRSNKHIMDDLDDIPRLTTFFLYVFNGELFRIGAFINENLKHVKQFTGYGEMYGLYTHSHGGVVHVTTLHKFNQRQLLDAMSHRAQAIPHDYRLNLIGGWFTVQDTNLSVCELLRNKVYTLKESETYFCIVVDKPRSKFNFQDISGLTKAFVLAKGEVYRVDMKILNRESPFRLDTEFTDMINSSFGYTAGDSVENEDLSNKLEYVGTEMEDFSSKKLETNIALVNSENPLDHNGSELSESPSEINERDYPDTCAEERTVENGVGLASSKKLETDNAPANSENLLGTGGSEPTELPGETSESKTPLEDGAEENSVVKKSQPVLPMKEASLESNTSEKNSESDREIWVNVKLSDVDSSHVSPADETLCEATNSENDKKKKVDPNAGSLDDEQKESMCNNSVPEKNCTLENENKINEDQRTQENDEDEDIRKEDDVMNNKRLPDENVSVTTDQQDEIKNMIMASKDEITVGKQQEDNVMKNERLRDEDVSVTTDQQDEKNMIMASKDEITVGKQQEEDNVMKNERLRDEDVSASTDQQDEIKNMIMESKDEITAGKQQEEDNVMKNERLRDEDVSASTDQQDEKNMIMASKGEITVGKQQEEDNVMKNERLRDEDVSASTDQQDEKNMIMASKNEITAGKQQEDNGMKNERLRDEDVSASTDQQDEKNMIMASKNEITAGKQQEDNVMKNERLRDEDVSASTDQQDEIKNMIMESKDEITAGKQQEEDNVMKNERLRDEDVSASTDQQDEKNMIMESKGEITAEKQEEDDGSSEKISTREDTIEKNIVPGAQQLQEIENDGDTKSGATVETEIIDETKGNSMTCKDNDSDDEKSQQKEKKENENEENEEDKNVKSDKVLTSENPLSTKEFPENHEPYGDVENEVKTSSESTEGEKLPNDGAFKETLVPEDSSKDKQVGMEQNNSTSKVEGQKNSSLPNTD